jgi:hypothetical protein
MIYLCIGEENALDWRRAYVVLRAEGWKSIDLAADIRRDIEKKPMSMICADGDGRLCTRTTRQRTIAHATAVRAITIPLGKTAPGGRSQDTHPHTDAPFLTEERVTGERWHKQKKCSSPPQRQLFPSMLPVSHICRHFTRGLVLFEIRCDPLHEHHLLSNS